MRQQATHNWPTRCLACLTRVKANGPLTSCDEVFIAFAVWLTKMIQIRSGRNHNSEAITLHIEAIEVPLPHQKAAKFHLSQWQLALGRPDQNHATNGHQTAGRAIWQVHVTFYSRCSTKT